MTAAAESFGRRLTQMLVADSDAVHTDQLVTHHLLLTLAEPSYVSGFELLTISCTVRLPPGSTRTGVLRRARALLHQDQSRFADSPVLAYDLPPNRL